MVRPARVGTWKAPASSAADSDALAKSRVGGVEVHQAGDPAERPVSGDHRGEMFAVTGDRREHRVERAEVVVAAEEFEPPAEVVAIHSDEGGEKVRESLGERRRVIASTAECTNVRELLYDLDRGRGCDNAIADRRDQLAARLAPGSSRPAADRPRRAAR